MKSLLKACFIAALFSTSASFAQGYLGVSGGQTELKRDCNVNGVNCDFKDTGYKVYGGYWFTPYIGLEAAYVDLGKATFSLPTVFGNAAAEVQASGFALFAAGAVPIDNFSLFGKLGFASLESEVTARLGGFSSSESSTKTNVAWGVGAGYKFTPNFGAQVEFERYRAEFNNDKEDVDFISLGVKYLF